jgi:hypothetical protein
MVDANIAGSAVKEGVLKEKRTASKVVMTKGRAAW